ncbi:leucine-rich repeat domain-containing protein [Bacteroides sp. BFG-606]|uniref:leucine-rich repeat domain-containing protein n=2 Tax=unclassified Bacteroides TaxID=2646097 RepID=UPI0021651354|nr:leucine-rich repeat domain-containing protein [Bacteroides sp. BFG-606]MCS2335576.1 leucine-rich repeat domain-containing protein [Bacteroides sp. BFG-606]
MSEELKGTNIYAPIVPGTDEDKYPTHDSKYGKGGYKEVSTLEERDSLPEERLRVGCKVYVVSEGKEYHYKGDGEWEESKGVAKLSELEDVEFTEDPRNGSVLVKQDDRWIPASEMFIPTGEMTDGTTIKTFDDLVGFIVSMSGGDKVQRNIRVVNNLDSKNLSASKGDPCILDLTFVSQERYSISDPYENTGERGLLQISVKNTVNSEYVVVKEMYIPSAVSIKVDIAEYLSSGANNVMVKVTGEVTEESTPAFVYTVQLTSLSISADNFKWWTAYTGYITLPLNIGGNIAKTLYVNVTGNGYNESYQVPLGTSIYTETAYNYSVVHPGTTGVYNISAYISNLDGTIKTKTVSFNVICAVAGEQAKLIAINNVLQKATNWTENILFDYSMYDGDNVNTSARFIITQNDESVFTSNEDSIACSTKHTFSFPMEIETMDNSDFEIVTHIHDDNGTELTFSITFPVNNSLGYSATAGAVFYMNPKTRSNRQGNRQEIVNEIDGTVIDGLWENMNWGNDGWQSDEDGNRALRLMAGSLLEMNYAPFSAECARTGKTFEIDYKIDNVTDYSEPVITISSPSGDSFVGLNIYADDIIMHTQSLKEDSVQSLHTFEGKRTRLTLTVLPNAYGHSELNLCILYINGRKNREFTYEDNDYFAHSGNIVIGSDYADVDVYGIREYNSGLTSQGVLRNLINWLVTTDSKLQETEDNDILDSHGSEIDFENTKDQFNVLVFDNTIPSMADQTQRIGNLEVLFYDHPEWNVTISNVTGKGQGTSSMKYWIWNTRYQLDKKLSVIIYADGTTSKAGAKWSMTPNLPAGRKFTAKKNYASSMQSHKIGAVNSYTDLVREVGILNEAMQNDEKVRVSVWEAPFVCFEKQTNDEGEIVYIFRGLYTFGPDKGDADTFGYNTDTYPDMISIEGSDNSPLCTLFRVPWNPDKPYIVYNEDKEAWQYNGANSWNFAAGTTENISRFIPAYNIVYQCSPRLRPFNGTLEELNARLADYKNEPYEFWIAKQDDINQYNVYYFESAEGRFMPSDIGEGQINLVTQLAGNGYGLSASDLTGKSNDELNALFINARISKFRLEAPLYWEIDDCLFFMNNVEFNAGTDERAKNTYPYCFGTITSKWRWRVDDADTRFDTTNRGLPDKKYSVETHDLDETGAAIWNGETNNFFNLMELAFPEEKIASMRKSMTGMQALGGLKSGNDLEKIYAFYQKYFFDQAQEYFPANAFNADAKYCYEYGKLAYNEGRYSNDTDPITQSLGDHYLAEQRWVTKRILYMMSKYSFGLFSANGTDTITVRAAGNTITYRLTPAMDMYPAIANGTSIIRGERTKAGEVCEMEIELSGSGDQQNAIQGASYLQDIGDWHNKNVTGSMIIQGRMLRDIRLGHKTEPVVISISSLTISNCVSLQKLILSNIATLSGNLNLSACTHLKEVYADGTSLSQIKLPNGGGLELIEFSAHNQYLLLSNYPLLTNDGVKIELCKPVLSDFFIVDCIQMRPMELLVSIMDAQAEQGTAHALKRIRAVGFEESYEDSLILEKLVDLSDGTYSGLSSEGLSGEDDLPVLDGTLNINASAYKDTVESLRETFKKLALNISGDFYTRFMDNLVQSLCAAHFGDGIGTSERQMGEVTELGNVFVGKEIKSFNELVLSKITSLTNEFIGCSRLDTITLPDTLKILATSAFTGSSIVLDLSDCSYITNLIIDSDDIIEAMPDPTDNLESVTYNSGSSKIRMVGYSKAVLKINNEDEIIDFWVENCDKNRHTLSTLDSIYSKSGHALRYIRAIGFEENFYGDGSILNTLVAFAENDYHGINQEGNRDDSIIPVLAGELHCSANYSPDKLYSLKSYYPNILFNMTGKAYIDFKDSTVKNMCVASWGSNGELTVEQAASVTNLGTKFKGNSVITSFDELKYFTGSKAIPNDPNSIGLPYGAFADCTNLENVTLMPNIKHLEGAVFAGCISLKHMTIPSSIEVINNNLFYNCTSLKTVNIPSGLTITKFPSDIFNNCVSLTSLIVILEKITSIGMRAFMNCRSLAGVKMLGTIPPTLDYAVFEGATFPIYVPQEAVNTYKSASGWTSVSSRIVGY